MTTEKPGVVSPAEMLAQLKAFVEKGDLSLASVEKEFGVSLQAAEPYFFTTDTARDPVVAKCGSQPAAAAPKFSLREEVNATTLSVPFRPGFTFTRALIEQVFEKSWTRRPAYEDRWVVYEHPGKDHVYVVTFYTSAECSEVVIGKHSKKPFIYPRPAQQ